MPDTSAPAAEPVPDMTAASMGITEESAVLPEQAEASVPAMKATAEVAAMPMEAAFDGAAGGMDTTAPEADVDSMIGAGVPDIGAELESVMGSGAESGASPESAGTFSEGIGDFVDGVGSMAAAGALDMSPENAMEPGRTESMDIPMDMMQGAGEAAPMAEPEFSAGLPIGEPVGEPDLGVPAEQEPVEEEPRLKSADEILSEISALTAGLI